MEGINAELELGGPRRHRSSIGLLSHEVVGIEGETQKNGRYPEKINGRVEGTGRKRPVSPPSSHRACRFPAHGAPTHFTMGRHD